MVYLGRLTLSIYSICFSIHIATAGDDEQVLIWDLSVSRSINPERCHSNLEPILSYHARKEVTGIQWPISKPEWIIISFENKLQMLKV